MKQKNYICIGDNLTFLREMKDCSIRGACITDPPYDSNKEYLCMAGNRAQSYGFNDTFKYEGKPPLLFEELKNSPRKEIRDAIGAAELLHGPSSELAYIATMTATFLEIYRVLTDDSFNIIICKQKPTYLLEPCLRAIFNDNFHRLTWCIDGTSRANQHPITGSFDILTMWKTEKARMNNVLVPSKKFEAIDYTLRKVSGLSNDTRKQLKHSKNLLKRNNKHERPSYDWFSHISGPGVLGNAEEFKVIGNERYPTQKPEALIEFLILLYTKPKYTVIDPFLGGGTAAVVAQRTGRSWVVMDITSVSLACLKRRLDKEYTDIDSIFTIEGVCPTTSDECSELIKKVENTHESRHIRDDLSTWIITFIGGIPNGKKSGDGGADGWTTRIHAFDKKSYVMEGKTGHVSIYHLQKLREKYQNDSNLVGGIFLTLEPPSKSMIEYASSCEFNIDEYGNKYPKMQILTFDDILDKKRMPKLPYRFISNYPVLSKKKINAVDDFF